MQPYDWDRQFDEAEWIYFDSSAFSQRVFVQLFSSGRNMKCSILPRTLGRGSLEQQELYERRLISNAHSEITRKRDNVFKQTKVGSKVQYFGYKLT